jgi:hypothetical protein
MSALRKMLYNVAVVAALVFTTVVISCVWACVLTVKVVAAFVQPLCNLFK